MSIGRVLISDSLDQEGVELLQQAGAEVDYRPKCTPEELLEIIPQYDALIVRSGTQVTAEVIRAGRNLKIVGRAGIGVNNIDLQAANEQGVIVFNVPDGNTISACEHAFGLMLAVARKIPRADASMRQNLWERNKFMGVELYGKTLGVVGFGRIGQEICKRALAFGMKVLASDPFVSSALAAERGARLCDLDELLSQSDFVTLHAPLTQSTRGMIGEAQLARMKPTAYLINAARGELIDEEALIRALQEGTIAGAGLDVFAQEPPQNSQLLSLENVVLTPHLGASTLEAQRLNAVEVAEQVSRYLNGRPIRNAVNLPTLSEKEWESASSLFDLAELLGRFYAQAIPGPVEQMEVIYSGKIEGRAVDIIARSALAGLLQEIVDEPVNPVNAPLIAEKKKIRLTTTHRSHHDPDQRVELRIGNGHGRHTLAGVARANGENRLTTIDGLPVDVQFSPHMLLTRHKDRPGIIGAVGTRLGEQGINIAAMQVGRRQAGEAAVMLLSIDNEADEKDLQALRSITEVEEVRVINLPERLIRSGA